jgi:Flp pilus assembly protein CpaB
MIAVALAAVAALLTSFYVTSYKRHVDRGAHQVTVFVAKADIPEGTTGEDAVRMLTTEDIPRKARERIAGAITKPDQLTGLVATQQTLQGEVVTTRRFGTQTELGVRAQLKGTDRAVEVWGDQTQLLAGTLKTGDHVDFVEATGSVSRVFIRNVKVLQAPSAPPAGSKLTSSISSKSSVMLKLTDNQTQKLQWLLAAAQSGEDSHPELWHLALRPVVHDADSTDHVDTWWSVLTDGLTRAEKNLFLFGQRKSPKDNNGG